ncbi:MAG TPA: helix-hairpin-helix domain-containing protein [Thermoanaerobaculia bacterium]|nr:helix-hairpin-helix domain-containing protein [Thermoanaerobaculia bacterium]
MVRRRKDTARQENQVVAGRLREAADLLREQGANPFRVNAYRNAAVTVEGLGRGVGDLIAAQGLDGLVALPHIGQGIGRAIQEMVRTGRWGQLDRLRGASDPEGLFRGVPGIGPALARRLHERLGVDSLEALEVAAHDGRLESVPGIGKRRAAAISAALATLLGKRLAPARADMRHRPGIGLLLDADREYRDKADRGELPRIAPKRFNPEGLDWLPVMHGERDGWNLTVLYSNTARAHELGKTHDWVVVYSYDDHRQEGQQTVVTESRGPLAGKRVVRGREAECLAYYSGLKRGAG